MIGRRVLSGFPFMQELPAVIRQLCLAFLSFKDVIRYVRCTKKWWNVEAAPCIQKFFQMTRKDGMGGASAKEKLLWCVNDRKNGGKYKFTFVEQNTLFRDSFVIKDTDSFIASPELAFQFLEHCTSNMVFSLSEIPNMQFQGTFMEVDAWFALESGNLVQYCRQPNCISVTKHFTERFGGVTWNYHPHYHENHVNDLRDILEAENSTPRLDCLSLILQMEEHNTLITKPTSYQVLFPSFNTKTFLFNVKKGPAGCVRLCRSYARRGKVNYKVQVPKDGTVYRVLQSLDRNYRQTKRRNKRSQRE